MIKKRRSKASATRKPSDRRTFGLGLPAFVLMTFLLSGGAWWALSKSDPVIAKPGEVIVYKSPTCGCCAKWVNHMRQAGFEVTVNDTSDLDAVKQQYGVPYGMGSCHTAVVDGYVIEGHVPATDVKRFLLEKPDAAGLAVPGMPIGSPGMEQGDYRERYAVLLFGEKGTKIFSKH